MQLSYRNFILLILCIFSLSIIIPKALKAQDAQLEEMQKIMTLKNYVNSLDALQLKEFQNSDYYRNWIDNHPYVTELEDGSTENLFGQLFTPTGASVGVKSGYNLRYSKSDIDWCNGRGDLATKELPNKFRNMGALDTLGIILTDAKMFLSFMKSQMTLETVINPVNFFARMRRNNEDLNAAFEVGRTNCRQLRAALARGSKNIEYNKISNEKSTINNLIDDTELFKSSNNLYSAKESDDSDESSDSDDQIQPEKKSTSHSCLYTPQIGHFLNYLTSEDYATGIDNIIMRAPEILGDNCGNKPTMNDLKIKFALSSKLGLMLFKKHYEKHLSSINYNIDDFYDTLAYNMPLLFRGIEEKKIHEKFKINNAEFKVIRYGDTLCIDTVSKVHIPGINFGNARTVGCKFIAEPLPDSMYNSVMTGNTGSAMNKKAQCGKMGQSYFKVMKHSQTKYPISSIVVYCVNEMLVKTIMNPKVCSIEDLNNTTNRAVIEKDSVLYKFQNSMRNYVRALLILYVLFFGVKILLDSVKPSTKTVFNFLFKIILVSYFATGATSSNMHQSDNLVGIILTLILNFGSTLSAIIINSNSSGLCDFSGVNYASGYEMLKLWDSLDCRIIQYLGFYYEYGAFPWYLILTAIAILLKDVNYVIWTLSYPILIMSIFASTVYIFITSLMLIFILVTLSPLFVPMVLFDKTKGYFKKWYTQIIALSIKPVLAFAFIIIFFSIYDNVYSGTCIYTSKDVITKPILSGGTTRTVKYFDLVTDKDRYPSDEQFKKCDESLGGIVVSMKSGKIGYMFEKIFKMETMYAILTGLIILYLINQLKDSLESFVGDLSGAIGTNSQEHVQKLVAYTKKNVNALVNPILHSWRKNKTNKVSTQRAKLFKTDLFKDDMNKVNELENKRTETLSKINTKSDLYSKISAMKNNEMFTEIKETQDRPLSLEQQQFKSDYNKLLENYRKISAEIKSSLPPSSKEVLTDLTSKLKNSEALQLSQKELKASITKLKKNVETAPTGQLEEALQAYKEAVKKLEKNTKEIDEVSNDLKTLEKKATNIKLQRKAFIKAEEDLSAPSKGKFFDEKDLAKFDTKTKSRSFEDLDFKATGKKSYQADINTDSKSYKANLEYDKKNDKPKKEKEQISKDRIKEIKDL